MSATASGSIGRGAAGTRLAWVERRWLLAMLYAALTAIALYPIFSVTVPPLVDYPNHLARMYILSHWESVPALQENYVTNWKLVPNMAMEIVVPLLAKVMSIYTAGKLFIAAALLMLLGGTMAVRWVLHGRVGPWPVLAYLLLYNHVLFWGFLNYLFAAGLALLGFAAWIALRERGRWQRATLFTLFSLALYVCHVFGLLIYGVLLLGYETWRARAAVGTTDGAWRDWFVAAVQFLAPGVLLLSWIAGTAEAGQALTDFGTFEDRAVIFFAPVHFNMTAADIAILMFLGMAWIAARSGRMADIAPSMIIPLIMLSIVALAMPVYLSGVWGTHIRLPVLIGCLLIAATRFRDAHSRRIPVLVIAAAVLFVARTALVSDQWRDLDAKFLEFRAAADAIPPGAKLLTTLDAADLPPNGPPLYAMQFWHMNALAVIERGAFVPTLFTGHTPIDAASVLKPINTPVGTPVSHALLALGADAAASPVPLGYRLDRYVRTYWIGWPEQFDYLLSIRFGNAKPLHPELVKPMFAGSFFDIGRIR
jgi:hypothetical protein